MALKQAEIQKMVKDMGLALIVDKATEMDVDFVQYADHSIAIPAVIEGKNCWAKISVVCGQLKDTKTSSAFDPYDAQAEWEADKEFKAKVQADKDKAKAEKIAKSKKK